MKSYLSNKYDLSGHAGLLDEIPLWSAPFGLKLLDSINYKSNITALDIGFGTGFPLTEIAVRLGSGSIVYGIEPWAEAIERAKQKINYYGITNIRLIEGNAENMPLPDNSVDLITSNNAINNVHDIDSVYSECSRIIKKGGQFIQTMNTEKSMFEFYDLLEIVLFDLGMTDEIDLMHRHIAEKRPSVSRLTSMMRKHGFVIKDLEYDQFNYKFANGTTALNHYFIRLAFMDSWIKLLPEDKLVPIFDRVESEMNKESELLGEIKFSIPYVMINAIRE